MQYVEKDPYKSTSDRRLLDLFKGNNRETELLLMRSLNLEQVR